MESKVINIVPKISPQITFYPFDKQTYLVQQKSHAHQLRINQATYDLLCLVNGERTISDIATIYN